jgi:hypothetical protein
MTKKNSVMIKILSLLNDLPVYERIEIIERIGKRLRQQNSIETSREVDRFATKNKLNKQVDDYPESGKFK